MADRRGTGIRLGSVAGTPVILQRSWFLIAIAVTLLLGPSVRGYVPEIGSGAGYLVALAFAGLLLGSVFLHELAHALTARAVGTPPTDIVLDLWGGHTAFASEVPTPGRTILVAGVGPLTNGVIAGLCLAAWTTTETGSVGYGLTVLLGTSNGFVAVLNALPGLPLDGGRVLEGIVWAVSGSRATGTTVAGWCGRVVAAGIVFWLLVRPLALGRTPTVFSLVWVLAVAWMLWQGASQSIRYAAWQRVAATVSAGRLMMPAVTVSSTASVAEARAAVASAGGSADAPGVCVVVLDIYGRPAAVLDDDALGSVPPQRAGLVAVSAVARPLPPVVLPPGLAGEALVARLQETPAGEYPVADGPRVVGVLTWRAVAEAVQGR